MELAKSSGHGQGHHLARLNRMIQVALISGLVLSMLFMVVGSVLYFLQTTTATTTSTATQSLLSGAASGNPLAFMHLGVIMLMITPALRVLVAALGYMLERDWVFALVSAGVVIVLAASLLIGAA